jgi:hypothetical protein
LGRSRSIHRQSKQGPHSRGSYRRRQYDPQLPFAAGTPVRPRFERAPAGPARAGQRAPCAPERAPAYGAYHARSAQAGHDGRAVSTTFPPPPDCSYACFCLMGIVLRPHRALTRWPRIAHRACTRWPRPPEKALPHRSLRTAATSSCPRCRAAAFRLVLAWAPARPSARCPGQLSQPLVLHAASTRRRRAGRRNRNST